MITFTITHIDKLKHANVMVVEGKVNQAFIQIGDFLSLQEDSNTIFKVIGIPLGLKNNKNNLFLTFQLHTAGNLKVGDVLFKQ